MSEYQNLILERDGPIAVVSFNRPDTLNAIESGIRREILQAVTEVNEDDSIRVVPWSVAESPIHEESTRE